MYQVQQQYLCAQQLDQSVFNDRSIRNCKNVQPYSCTTTIQKQLSVDLYRQIVKIVRTGI